MMNNGTTTEVAPVIVSDKQILHRGDAQGIAITRVQTIRYQGIISEVRFWTNLTSGKTHRIELVETK